MPQVHRRAQSFHRWPCPIPPKHQLGGALDVDLRYHARNTTRKSHGIVMIPHFLIVNTLGSTNITRTNKIGAGAGISPRQKFTERRCAAGCRDRQQLCRQKQDPGRSARRTDRDGASDTSGLGTNTTATTSAPEKLTPAVPIRRSVQPEYVVCLECGFRGITLRRHLQAAHGLEPAAYRARWKLATNHALTAPAYSERRSTMAKQLGFGRKRAEVEPPARARRGRRRQAATE